MAEDPKAKQEPEKEAPEAPVPSAEQKTTEPEAVGEEAKEITQPAEGEALPEGASERTKREFEKVKQDRDDYREQLREERARREYFETVFSSMQPQKQPEAPPVIDAETGLPNEQVLTDIQRRSQEAEQRAQRAEEAIQGYMAEQENRAVFAKYPELNPASDKFDRKLHAEVRSRLLDSMLNPNDYGGRQLGFLEAAEMVKGVAASAIEEAKKKGATEAMEQTESKEQASLEATGTSGRRTEIASDLEELKHRTRKGDINAIVERLKGIQE